MQRSATYQFEWDPDKARSNLRKHGVAFEQATTIFRDPRALSRFDPDHSQDEDRWITSGLDRNGVLLVICHTFRKTRKNAAIRIISARKATKKEIKQYEEL